MRSWFGEPGSVEKSSLPGCVEQWCYHYSITDDWKQGTVSKTFTAFFDEKGLLCAANYSCTGRCVGADMVAGGEEAKGEVSIFDGCRSFKTPEQRPNCDRIVMNIGVVPPHVVGV